ncbi:MAG: inositol monophosphatase family protein [Promethearchaeota archaeon]
MKIDLDFLKELAKEAYDSVHGLIGTTGSGKELQRGAGGDISMQIDMIAEKRILNLIERSGLNLKVISEEIGEIYIGNVNEARKNNDILIIDPVDGSNNAVRGIPYCAVSIAHAIGKSIDDIKEGVVLDLINKDLYWAIKNNGSFHNSKELHVSNLDFSNNCFLELNLPKKSLLEYLKKITPLLRKFYRIRVQGCTSLTLCQIAKGTMDAFINLRKTNRIVDSAAGILILKEAGGRILSLKGTPIEGQLSINLRFPFIASNELLSEQIIKELQEIQL